MQKSTTERSDDANQRYSRYVNNNRTLSFAGLRLTKMS